MSAQKARLARRRMLRRAADDGFGAARISHQRAIFRRGSNRGKRLNRRANRQGHIDQIRAAHRAREIPRRFAHRAAGKSRLQSLRAVESYDRDVREMFAQRQAERSADQAGSEDGHALEGNCARRRRHAIV